MALAYALRSMAAGGKVRAHQLRRVSRTLPAGGEKSRFARTRRGAARTESSGGGATAAARPARSPLGDRPGARRCAGRSTVFATRRARSSRRRRPILLADPWRARDAYIEVVLDRSPESLDRFLEAQAVRPLSEEQRVRARMLLELERHAMLMYTSCGWFFDDLAGIESRPGAALRRPGRAARGGALRRVDRGGLPPRPRGAASNRLEDGTDGACTTGTCAVEASWISAGSAGTTPCVRSSSPKRRRRASTAGRSRAKTTGSPRRRR